MSVQHLGQSIVQIDACKCCVVWWQWWYKLHTHTVVQGSASQATPAVLELVRMQTLLCLPLPPTELLIQKIPGWSTFSLKSEKHWCKRPSSQNVKSCHQDSSYRDSGSLLKTRWCWGNWHVFSLNPPPYSGVIENELNKTQRFHQSMHWISSFKQKKKGGGKRLGKGKQERRRHEETLGPHMLGCNPAFGCPHAWDLILAKWRNLDRLPFIAICFLLHASLVLFCFDLCSVWLQDVWCLTRKFLTRNLDEGKIKKTRAWSLSLWARENMPRG